MSTLKMKHSLVFNMLIAFTIILISSSPMVAQEPSGKSVTPEVFSQKMKKRKTIILDVRTSKEYNEGHIPGALNVDVQDTTLFPRWIKGQNRRTKYLLYCRSGKRSAQALRMMEEAGYRHLVDLQGGITAWKGEVTKEQ